MEAKSVSLKKQYKGIRPLGRLVSIKHDDLDAASSSQGPEIAGLWKLRGRRTRERVTLNSLPALCLHNYKVLETWVRGKLGCWLSKLQDSDVSADFILPKMSPVGLH